MGAWPTEIRSSVVRLDEYDNLRPIAGKLYALAALLKEEPLSREYRGVLGDLLNTTDPQRRELLCNLFDHGGDFTSVHREALAGLVQDLAHDLRRILDATTFAPAPEPEP